MAEDVELCLEVQVDAASRKILANPTKCRSALLDVTVVKPKEMEAFGTKRTNTLRACQVRKLIASLEKQRREKQKFIDSLKEDDTIIKVRKHEEPSSKHRRYRKPFTKHKERIIPCTPIDDLERKDFIGIGESVQPLFCEIRKSLKNVENRISGMQDINLVLSQSTMNETISEDCEYTKQKDPGPSKHLRNSTVYRCHTPTPDLSSILLCKNKDRYGRGDKVEGQCMCQNCGTVGLLMECQKHPLLTELSESPPPSEYSRPMQDQRKHTRFSSPKVEEVRPINCDNSAYIYQLSKRIRHLEERLAVQEEKAVPRDYFKKVINKLVNNFSRKVEKSKSEISVQPSEKLEKPEKKNSKRKAEETPKSPSYAEKVPKSPLYAEKAINCNSVATFSCFHSSPEKPFRHTRRSSLRNDKSTVTDDDLYYSGHIWRWGEEILRPGIDLKNRIMTLLNDILSKFAINENGPTEGHHKNFMEKEKEYDRYNNHNMDSFKKIMKHVNAKVFNVQIDPKERMLARTNEKSDREDREENFEILYKPTHKEYKRQYDDQYDRLKVAYQKAHQPRKHSAEGSKNIDVSYFNPKLSSYPKENATLQKSNLFLGKQEFLKIVSRMKPSQKETLWKNIWSQAKVHRQTREDKITIKIPAQNKDNRKENEMFETELTIGEVEIILGNHIS